MAETVDGIGEGEDNGNIKLAGFIFMQPPILKALFEQLPREDLASCRLVNKTWYRESASTWRSNATLKFEKGGIVSTRDDGTISTSLIGEFLDLWEAGDWGSCPFKKFHLHGLNFKADDVEQKRFMKLVGGHVTSLTLEQCSFEGRDNFRRIIYQAFPKLQFLKMDHCKVDNVWYRPAEEILPYEEPTFGVHGLKSLEIICNYLPHSMMDMLSHFHRIESLHMEVESRSYPHRNLLETIRLIRAQDRTKLPLKTFDVHFYFRLDPADFRFSIELLKLHEELNLPLHRFAICLSDKLECEIRNDDVSREILQYRSAKLKHLEIKGNGGYVGFHNSFPFGIHFENLEKLIIHTYNFSNNLNYLKYMPKLRFFEIRDYSCGCSRALFSNSSQLKIGDWTLGSLTDLRFELPLSYRNLKRLMRWMPNVEYLRKIELTDGRFALVCKNWKNLKYLEDIGTELTDKGVIGIGNDRGNLGSQDGPNITKLKQLTYFETWSRKLTSTSIHGGFLKLANLKELLITQESIKLDDATRAALKRRKIKCNL